MKILVTGSKGFVGKNLVESLRNIKDGKDKRAKYQALLPLTIYEYDRDSEKSDLLEAVKDADFVFNLAGINRPLNAEEFMEGNHDFASELLDSLAQENNTCGVMLSSSIQASLEGRYAGSEYGRSKLAGEEVFKEYSDRTGSKVYIYRFANLYGKWSRPNYNSVVATFCHNVSRGLPIRVDDPDAAIDLLYIDDVIDELLSCLIGEESRIDAYYCAAGPVEETTVGEIANLLEEFEASRRDLSIPDQSSGTLSKNLHATYLSFRESGDFSYPLTMNIDDRGSFTEFLRTPDRGQVSINVSKPGITKGEHWHHTKWEKFCVVSGEGLIQLRQVGVDENGEEHPVVEYRVSGAEMTVVEMTPGYTHNLINLSDDEDMITLMWANESFDPADPDTYGLEVR